MAKRLLMIEGSEERLDLVEKEIAKNKGELGYNVVDIGYNYDEDGWCFARFIVEGFVKAISIEWIKSKIDAILDNYPDGNEETEILCKLLYEWEKENADL